MKSLKIASIMAAALLTGVVAGAQGGPGPGFGEHRPPMERALGPHGAHGQWWNDPQVVQQLKLTDDQRKTMDKILQEHREKLVDMRGNLEKAELAMEPLMKADQPNESQILSQIDRVAQARAELEKANARFLLALRAKLSPEQWKQLQAERMNHREFRHEGGERGPRHPGMAPGGAEPGPAAPPQGGGPGPQSLLNPPPAGEAFDLN